MKDYRQLNVYSLNKFELYSQKRNARFRFIKYDGQNYQEICDYIHELSPNTQIWEEKLLIPGTLYTFSGRDYTFNNINPWEIRCCIANNPFIIIDGKEQPLTLTQSEAESYLRRTEGGRVFCYDNICSDYMYDETKDKYCVYDKNHLRGIIGNSLGSHEEWYIGEEDGMRAHKYCFTPRYQNDTHTVHLDFDLIETVDRIQDSIYKINKYSKAFTGKLVFSPSFEDSQRFKTLSRKCLDSKSIEEFVRVLYIIMYESTKGPDLSKEKNFQITKGALPLSLQNDPFLMIVGEYRNHFSHGNAEYCSKGRITMPQIYLKYIHTNNEPNSASDFETLQLELLNDTEEFVKRVLEEVLLMKTVSDYISYDEDSGCVCCLDVALPSIFKKYVGCKCVMEGVLFNEFESEKFPFYSSQILVVDFSKKGIIRKSETGSCLIESIMLPKRYGVYEGCVASVTKIQVRKRNKELLESALDFKIMLDKPRVGELVYDDRGKPSVDDMLLDEKLWDNLPPGRYLVEFKTIICTTHKNGSGFSRKEEVDGVIIEGVSQRIKPGVYICGNIQLEKTMAKGCGGKRIRLNKVLPNKEKNSPYPFYSDDFVVIVRRRIRKDRPIVETEAAETKQTRTETGEIPKEPPIKSLKEIFNDLKRLIKSKFSRQKRY